MGGGKVSQLLTRRVLRYTSYATSRLVMEVQQLNELRRAVCDLRHRGLLHSARWAAEHVVALHEVHTTAAQHAAVGAL